MTQNAINNSASVFDVDNIHLDGNTVSTTDTNGNLVLLPDGTGLVTIGSGASANYLNRLRSSAGQWDAYNDGTDTFGDYNSAGSPESSIAANIGSLCRDTTNGDLYIKTTDTVNTGWDLIGGGTSGRLVQVVATTTNTETTTTTVIPLDGTIPQQTEGTEVLTVAITPTDSSNRLIIYFNSIMGQGTPSNGTIALFQDATANALTATRSFGSSTALNFSDNSTLIYTMTAGTTSSTTFKIRIGPNTGSGNYQLQTTTAYGAAAFGSLIVYEVAS